MHTRSTTLQLLQRQPTIRSEFDWWSLVLRSSCFECKSVMQAAQQQAVAQQVVAAQQVAAQQVAVQQAQARSFSSRREMPFAS